MLEKERFKINNDIILLCLPTSYFKSYFDANVGYKFNTQLTGLYANNIANQSYQKNG
jgi:hypothetical protein